MLSLGVKIEEKFSKKFFDHFLVPKNGFLNFRIRLIIKKSQLCPIALNFFWWDLGSWKTLRVIGWAQNGPIYYRLEVTAKKLSFLGENVKNG